MSGWNGSINRGLISKLFQQNPKHRHSGMDRRNLGSMDGGAWSLPSMPHAETHSLNTHCGCGNIHG